MRRMTGNSVMLAAQYSLDFQLHVPKMDAPLLSGLIAVVTDGTMMMCP
jgi:hypothetical protein